MKSEGMTWVVGWIDWFDHELVLEQVTASNWQEAVIQHSKFPFPRCVRLDNAEEFKERCFDVDCMMNWHIVPKEI